MALTVPNPSAGKLLDYDQYIEHQIGLTRTRIRMTDVLTALVLLSAAVLGVLFLEIVLDHAFGLPVWVRAVLLVGGLGGAVAFAAWKIVVPMTRRVNQFYAARAIESIDPKFKNSLITYLDLRARGGSLPKTFLAAVESKAVADLEGVEIDTVVDQRPLVKTVYGLAVVVVLVCLYSLLTPKSILDSAKRAFLADVARPTNTRLVNVRPGDDPKLSTVTAGSDVGFSVEVNGTRPDAVTLHYSLDGGTYFSQLPLKRGKSDFDPWLAEVKDVHVTGGAEALPYFFTGGDATTSTFELTVRATPMILEVSHDLLFPSYIQDERALAGLPRTVEGIDGGDIEAIEGSLAVVHASTNEPARSARIEFGPDRDGRDLDPVSMSVDRDNPQTLIGRFRVDADRTYKIFFENKNGELNRNPVIHDVRVIPDRPPTAQILAPEPVVQVPANGTVGIRLKATDDHGVEQAILYVRQGSETLRTPKDFLEKSEPKPDLEADELLNLADLRVAPGEKFEYWLEVLDTKTPLSNRAETPHYVIEVGEPLPPEEAQAQRDEARQELESKSPPPPDPANPDPADPPPADADPGAGEQPPDPDQNTPPDAPSPDQPGGGDSAPQELNNDSGQPPQDGEAAPQNAGQGQGNDQGANDLNQPPPLTPEQREKLDRLQQALDQPNPPQADPRNQPQPQPGGQRGESAPNSGNQPPSQESGNAAPRGESNPPSNPAERTKSGDPRPNEANQPAVGERPQPKNDGDSPPKPEGQAGNEGESAGADAESGTKEGSGTGQDANPGNAGEQGRTPEPKSANDPGSAGAEPPSATERQANTQPDGKGLEASDSGSKPGEGQEGGENAPGTPNSTKPPESNAGRPNDGNGAQQSQPETGEQVRQQRSQGEGREPTDSAAPQGGSEERSPSGDPKTPGTESSPSESSTPQGETPKGEPPGSNVADQAREPEPRPGEPGSKPSPSGNEPNPSTDPAGKEASQPNPGSDPTKPPAGSDSTERPGEGSKPESSENPGNETNPNSGANNGQPMTSDGNPSQPQPGDRASRNEPNGSESPSESDPQNPAEAQPPKGGQEGNSGQPKPASPSDRPDGEPQSGEGQPAGREPKGGRPQGQAQDNPGEQAVSQPKPPGANPPSPPSATPENRGGQPAGENANRPEQSPPAGRNQNEPSERNGQPNEPSTPQDSANQPTGSDRQEGQGSSSQGQKGQPSSTDQQPKPERNPARVRNLLRIRMPPGAITRPAVSRMARNPRPATRPPMLPKANRRRNRAPRKPATNLLPAPRRPRPKARQRAIRTSAPTARPPTPRGPKGRPNLAASKARPLPPPIRRPVAETRRSPILTARVNRPTRPLPLMANLPNPRRRRTAHLPKPAKAIRESPSRGPARRLRPRRAWPARVQKARKARDRSQERAVHLRKAPRIAANPGNPGALRRAGAASNLVGAKVAAIRGPGRRLGTRRATSKAASRAPADSSRAPAGATAKAGFKTSRGSTRPATRATTARPPNVRPTPPNRSVNRSPPIPACPKSPPSSTASATSSKRGMNSKSNNSKTPRTSPGPRCNSSSIGSPSPNSPQPAPAGKSRAS